MDGLPDSRGVLHWSVATLLAGSTTFALAGLHVGSAAAGMVFLALVVWSATQAGVVLSIYIATLCALSFDYFFLPPYHTLRLADVEQWVEMFTFVACCLLVSRVAERARRQTRQAEQRRKDVERLYELSQELMLYEDADGLIRDLPRLIDRIFSLDGVVLYVYERDQFHSSTSKFPLSIEASLRAMAQGPNPTLAIPGDMTARPLMVGMRPVGSLAWKPADLSLEVSAAVCAQVSIVIARSLALEATARLEAAREGERLRTALIDSLTHELRTPLTSIRAAATTLLEAAEMNEAGRRDMAAIIDEEATRLDMLVGDAVEMAEIDAQVVKVQLAPHQPRALLDEAVEESRQALKKQRVTIVTDPAEPDQPAWFDLHLLSRVLRHLLENAAVYTPAGTHVKLSSRRRNGRLEFIVEDDGPGIDVADLPLIFEKFYRGKRGISMAKGSGMGLAITRAILTTHGGGIEATNGSNGGARFRFWVPLVEKEPEATA
jgi:two-component system sensor histidine kinase KdpD